MQLFHPEARYRSPEHKRIYAYYELWYTAVDFIAAMSFLIGSVLFFWEATQTAATWLFVIGSVCFALKPSIRLAREIRFVRMGRFDALAERDD